MSETLRTSRVVFLVALLAALIPFAYVVTRLAKRSEWLSVPRRMPFVTADGKTLPQSLTAPDECRLGDIAFSMLVDGDKVWIPCKDGNGGGGLARMDLSSKRVEYRWQFPSWKVGWTRGLALGKNGSLATVVGVEGGLGVAATGPDGWAIPPTSIRANESDRVLAVVYRQNAVELAMSHIDASKTPAWSLGIWTIAASGNVNKQAVDVCGEKCGGVHGAYLGADEKFHFLVAPDFANPPHDVTPDGKGGAIEAKLTSFIQLDSTASGAVGTPFRAPFVLSESGAVQETPPPPVWLQGNVVPSIAFRRSSNLLSRIPLYTTETARLKGDGPIVYGLSLDKSSRKSGSPGTPSFEDETLGLVTFEESTLDLQEKTPKTTIARIHECSSLGTDGALVKVGDETIVFDPSGCYVVLDDKLQRKDAWGLFDHLRMRGSMYLEWNERSHAVKLFFVLLAPLLVLGAWLGRKRFPRAAIAFALFTPAIAIWCSVGLSDILR